MVIPITPGVSQDVNVSGLGDGPQIAHGVLGFD